MKKVLVCALAALFLMASCLTAFAETPNYVTETSYINDGDVTSLYVKTTVTGAVADTMLTYLAYNGASATDESVVFIDQKTADGVAPVVFDYTTEKDNLTTVTVKFGTSAEDANYPITKELDENARVITVNVVDGDNATIILPSEVGTSVNITDIEVPTGYTLVSAVIGETDVANLIDIESGVVKVNDGAALVDDAVITITLEEPWKYPVAVENTAAGHFNGFESGLPVEKMTVFGKADTDMDVDEGDWGGMLLSRTNGDFKYGDEGVEIYPAKYRGEDGTFAVQLVNKDEEKELTTNTWYARVYVKASTGNFAYGRVETFEPIVVDAE